MSEPKAERNKYMASINYGLFGTLPKLNKRSTTKFGPQNKKIDGKKVYG